ncbi:MAG: hypothetical protein AABY86_15595, partial [Bdellovibrionota bacterium]
SKQDKKKMSKLAVEDDDGYNSKENEVNQKNESKKRKLEAPKILERPKEEMHGHSQPADYIEKYYNQKKRIRPEVKQNWNGLANREKTQTATPQLKPLGEQSLNIEKENLGEQTIDYKKIKEEFAALDGAFTHQVKTRDQISEQSEHPSNLSPGGTAYGAQNVTDQDGNIQTIYYPNSKGIEYAVRALYLYADKDAKDIDILTYLGKTMHSKLKGRISFLRKDINNNLYIELFNGHLYFRSLISEIDNSTDSTSTPLTAPQIISAELWETYKLQNLNSWSQTRLPSWSDETFQKENLTYVYPYYEGTDCMGFAVIDFAGKVDQSQAPLIEILCESARSIYLYNYHLTGKHGLYQARTNVPKDDQQSGIFGRIKGLFGKKAG